MPLVSWSDRNHVKQSEDARAGRGFIWNLKRGIFDKWCDGVLTFVFQHTW